MQGTRLKHPSARAMPRGSRADGPGDRSAGTAAGFQSAGEGLNVGAANREQEKVTGTAPAGEPSQVKRERLTGQAAVTGQEPCEREPLGISEHRLNREREVRSAHPGLGRAS